ncbi:hypothetical protein M4V62_04440 [Streptomyces durmitorensis]|uniref:Uncharacterized protein n=1 Tax=Streptomyces durmitorensis TaxID=319947 RepID=A0ABY4PMW5_9ACTN|nr:hypothetical protein [Streptomyces durmitorensis]UQT54396.1 hypothetical protein M4V62_04440 [Streptomyces durmitorensis]
MTRNAAEAFSASHGITIPLEEGLALLAAAGTSATITADEITDVEQSVLDKLEDGGLLG